ncbi:hypothetical protein D3C71_1364570 [compost metagenome]
MEQRYEPHEVSYAHVAVLNLRDGRIAVGVRLSKRSLMQDGRVWYEPYAVCSLYYGPSDIRNDSTRQAIPVIVADILRSVSHETRLLVIKGNTPHFQKYWQLEPLINAFAISSNRRVKVTQKKHIELSIPELMALANDAVNRGTSLTKTI